MPDHSAMLIAVAPGRLSGLEGVIARTAAPGPKKRSQIATQAAKAQWVKKWL